MKFPVGHSSLVYARGYLFFGSDSRLFARAFDEATLEFVGEPIELLRGIPITQLGRMPFWCRRTDRLPCGRTWRHAGHIAVAHGDGVTTSVVETPARYLGLALAPDARRLAVSRRNAIAGRTSESGISPDPRRRS